MRQHHSSRHKIWHSLLALNHISIHVISHDPVVWRWKTFMVEWLASMKGRGSLAAAHKCGLAAVSHGEDM